MRAYWVLSAVIFLGFRLLLLLAAATVFAGAAYSYLTLGRPRLRQSELPT